MKKKPLLFARPRMRAFTLIELLVVIGIITLLVSIGGYTWQELSRRAKATSIVHDLKEITGAWELWRIDSHHAYPLEGAYPLVDRCNSGTSDTALMRVTHLYDTDQPFLDGTTPENSQADPYLTQNITDPWGNEYGYDNDGNAATADTCAAPHHGVNITLDWCRDEQTQYVPLLTIMDRSLDSGDGACVGKLRWIQRNWGGRMYYRVDPLLNN